MLSEIRRSRTGSGMRTCIVHVGIRGVLRIGYVVPLARHTRYDFVRFGTDFVRALVGEILGIDESFRLFSQRGCTTSLLAFFSSTWNQRVED